VLQISKWDGIFPSEVPDGYYNLITSDWEWGIEKGRGAGSREQRGKRRQEAEF
jgi:hypothetical protein